MSEKNPFDFESDNGGGEPDGQEGRRHPQSRESRPKRPEPERQRERPLTAGKLALIIWGPVAGVAALILLIWCGCAGVNVVLHLIAPREPNPLTDR